MARKLENGHGSPLCKLKSRWTMKMGKRWSQSIKSDAIAHVQRRVRGQIRNLDWRSKIIVTLACRCMKEVGYEENPLLQTFEELELKFRDEIIKLSKEQTDAADACKTQGENQHY